MKNKRIFKTFSALCAALVLMMGLSVTAFAQGTEQPPAEDATNDENAVSYTHLDVRDAAFLPAGDVRKAWSAVGKDRGQYHPRHGDPPQAAPLPHQ